MARGYGRWKLTVFKGGSGLGVDGGGGGGGGGGRRGNILHPGFDVDHLRATAATSLPAPTDAPILLRILQDVDIRLL